MAEPETRRPGQVRRRRRKDDRIAKQKKRYEKRKKKATGGPAVTKVKMPTSGGKRVNVPSIYEPKPKPKKERGYGQAQEGRGGYSHGGSVSARLSKAGPVAKPN